VRALPSSGDPTAGATAAAAGPAGTSGVAAAAAAKALDAFNASGKRQKTLLEVHAEMQVGGGALWKGCGQTSVCCERVLGEGPQGSRGRKMGPE
jgi:hypothetical protein